MKTNINWIRRALLFCAITLCPPSADATQIDVIPRIEAGMVDYSISYEALSETTLTGPGQPTGYNETRTKVEYNDNLPVIGGGATIFINRLFVDLSGEYAYDGTSTATALYASYWERDDGQTIFTGMDYISKGRFDHNSRAIAVGYTFRPAISVFLGYKWTDLNLKTTTDSVIKQLLPDAAAKSKTLSYVESDVRFKYEGPFIGIKHGSEINAFKYLNGMASLKLGLAFLNSRYTSVRHARSIDTFDGEVWYDEFHSEDKGDTWGFMLGLSWRGLTPIQNLSYALKIDGYRYHFNSKSYEVDEMTETVLKYKLEISYAF